jgi:hypothetical protein
MFEDTVMKHNQHYEKERRRRGGWEYNGGGELVPSTLYTCVELPRKTPCIINVTYSEYNKNIFESRPLKVEFLN